MADVTLTFSREASSNDLRIKFETREPSTLPITRENYQCLLDKCGVLCEPENDTELVVKCGIIEAVEMVPDGSLFSITVARNKERALRECLPNLGKKLVVHILDPPDMPPGRWPSKWLNARSIRKKQKCKIEVPSTFTSEEYLRTLKNWDFVDNSAMKPREDENERTRSPTRWRPRTGGSEEAGAQEGENTGIVERENERVLEAPPTQRPR
ncbi:hypothetical protein ACJZ2D_012859 [Fusarium nematophilum]